MQDLTISFIQTTIHWEDKDANLSHFHNLIDRIDAATDVILLPEMFNTGFSMHADRMAESMDGRTITWMKTMAHKKNASLIGSLIIQEANHYHNRLIVANPDGTVQSYDKRHLFRMAEEDKTYTASTSYLIVDIKGWKIRPLVCYDLRFPVWSRNKYNGEWEYDLLLYIANWPAARTTAWKTLPVARAIENQAYVATLNRIGQDNKGNTYTGDSQLINSYGEILLDLKDAEQVVTMTLDRARLIKHRRDFPVGLDADIFDLVV